MTIAASATDPDGSVVRVEFLANGAVLGEDAAAPYAFSWAGAPAGTHTLTVRATDNVGAVTTSAPVTISVSGSAGSGGGTGLTAEYFDTPDFNDRRILRTDPTVNFNWGTAGPGGGMAGDTYSVRWTGQVAPPTSGSYVFHTDSDEGGGCG